LSLSLSPEQESAVADEQAELGLIEEEKVALVQQEVGAFEAQCAMDLAAAEPAIAKMGDSIDALDRAALVELKNMSQPPKEVEAVLSSLLILFARRGGGAGALKKLDVSWSAARKVLTNLDTFLTQLREYDRDGLPPEQVRG